MIKDEIIYNFNYFFFIIRIILFYKKIYIYKFLKKRKIHVMKLIVYQVNLLFINLSERKILIIFGIN